MRGKRYSGDPYWLTLKYQGTCSRCGDAIPRGADAFRFKSGALYCTKEECGGKESRAFESAAFDESMYTGNW